MKPLRPARWLLAPLLATAAAAASFWLNVPDELSVASHEIPKAAADATQRRTGPVVEAWPRRDAARLQRLWDRYAGVDLEDEPIEEAWARARRETLTELIVATRQTVFAGAPEPPQVIPGPRQCHTIRCRFSLCGPVAHEVRLLNETLRSLTWQGRSLWLDYAAVVSRPGDALPPDELCLQITVAPAFDDPELERLAVAGQRQGTGRADEATR